MTTEQKAFAIVVFLWFWDSALGSPVLTRMVSIQLLEQLLEHGVIGHPSLERMAIATIVTVIGLFFWMKKVDTRAKPIDMPKASARSDRKRYAQDHTPNTYHHTDPDILQDKEISFDHIGQGSLSTNRASASVGDGINTETSPLSYTLFGAGVEPPSSPPQTECLAPQMTVTATTDCDDASSDSD